MCPVTCGISRIGPAATNLKSQQLSLTEMRRRLFDRRQPSPIGVRQVKGVPRTEDDYAQCVAAANALLGLSGSGPNGPQAKVARLVWDDGQCEASLYYNTIAREEPYKVIPLDGWSPRAALRDGRTLVVQKPIGSVADSACPSYHSEFWKDIASTLVVKEKSNGKAREVELTHDGLSPIGAGGYNVVASVKKKGVLPEYLPTEVVLRITRPDQYTCANLAVDEAAHTIFAARNGIGTPLYALGIFKPDFEYRRLRKQPLARCVLGDGAPPVYGSVYVMQAARENLQQTIKSNDSRKIGMELAVAVTDLIVRASRCGVAHFDIKPENILTMHGAGGVPYYRLTDCDPAFFLVLLDADWRALLLLNLTLLSAHVRNTGCEHAIAGWVSVVGPVLEQLLEHRQRYEGEWLFATRAVRVACRDREGPDRFELQHLLCQVATHYLWCREKAYESSKWGWAGLEENARELREHWKCAANRSSWPPTWATNSVKSWYQREIATAHKPLIEQMVAFALGKDLVGAAVSQRERVYDI